MYDYNPFWGQEQQRRGLTVGDPVFIRTHPMGHDVYLEGIVSRITKTQIRAIPNHKPEYEYTFMLSTGEERGHADWDYHPTMIAAATPQAVEWVKQQRTAQEQEQKRRDMIAQVRKANPRELNDTELEQICAVLDAAERRRTERHTQ